MRKLAKNIISIALSVSAFIGSSAMAADLSGWAVSEYQSANEAGLISYSVVSNNLMDDITRQEFCELAVNLYKKLTNEDIIAPAVSPFKDTDSVAVAQAYCYGIVSGTGEENFTPNRLVTREEMAKMLVSTLTASEVDITLSDGSDSHIIDDFSDSDDVSIWAKHSVITMLNYSLMNGVTSDEFIPLGSTTREQAIASVNRAHNAFGDNNYAVALPIINLPEDGAEIEHGDFEVSWSGVSGAQWYNVIIKDASAKAVFFTDVYNGSSIEVKADWLAGAGEYSIVVGAVMADGSEVYSLPVDFTLKAKAVVSNTQYLADNDRAQALLDEAAKYLGVPYLWGGTTPKGFDCSGFVQYVYKQNGITINRVADDQRKNGTYVSRANLQPGDLVFFGSGNYANHVGLYVGNGEMIHAPSTGKNIMYTSINSDYYKSRFIEGRRIFN